MNRTAPLCVLVVIGAGIPACSGSPGAGGPTDPEGPGSPAGPTMPALPGTLAGRIVFVRGEGGSEVLMTSAPDGAGAASLRTPGRAPHVSPDGRRVVYNTAAGGIAVLDLATRQVAQLTADLSMFPRWSPDGRRILSWSRRTGNPELWTINADGSSPVRLTSGGGENLEADWSPDGRRIVFRRVTDDGGDIWTINADGTGAEPLYVAPRMQLNPQWSPDGRQIAFNGMVPRTGGPGVTSKVFVIDVDGSGLRQVSQGDLDDWGAGWSPDSQRIIFFRKITDPDNDVLSVRADGTDLRVLVTGPTNDYHPQYGPEI
jgi:TolB protein